MEWPDYVILGIIGASVLMGLWRGFITEFFALVIWVAAFLAAYTMGRPAAGWIGESVTQPSVRLAIGFMCVFLAVLLVGAVLNYLVGRLVESTGLSGTDRLVGAVFGGVRGLVLVILLLLAAGMTPMPLDPWWKSSVLINRLMPMCEWAQTLLPEAIADIIDLDPEPLESGAEDEPEQAEVVEVAPPGALEQDDSPD